jgi:small GTP-binding protein
VSIDQEIQRRRTFAIISHPDAGKTTLTEKLLLYGGAVQLAGSVTARKNQRATTSDWMELEKKRGISISSTVLQFDYDGYRLNLLDTPGHKDFSEDTYRVLTAVDAVVMVIDSAKGIEPQTRKLFEVCRQRGVPIFTFMNKCDRPMKNPLELIDELERVLGIGAFPVNWPIGNGPEFQGIYDRQTKTMHTFERVVGGKYRAPVVVGGLHDPEVRGNLSEAEFAKTLEELEMLELAGESFDVAAVLAGKTTPVFFGSGVNNFGVQLLLDGFPEALAPAPKSRVMGGIEIAPENPGVLRIHLQDPGEHGPATPRPHRVHPRVLRQVRARHDRASLALREERCASPARTNCSATNAKRWTKRIPATSSASSATTASASATRSRPIRRLPTRKSRASRRKPSLPAQSEHGEVQTIPPGPRSTFAGRRHSGAVSAQLVGENAAARRRRPAAIRSRAIPPRKRIRR